MLALALDLVIGFASVGWLELRFSVLTDGQVGGCFEVDQVVVDGLVDTAGVWLGWLVGSVMVSLDDEEHAVFEVFGEVSAGFERGGDVAGGADSENGWGAGPSERWRRIQVGGPHTTQVPCFDLERAEAGGDSKQLVDHVLGWRRGGGGSIKT